MKKFNLLKSIMLLCMLMVGMGAWAAESVTKTYTLSDTNNGKEVSTGDVTWTIGSDAITGSSGNMKLVGTITVTLPSGASLSSVEITKSNNWGSGATVIFASGSTTLNTFSGSGSYDLASHKTDLVYTFTKGGTASKNAWVKTISVTYTVESVKTLSSISVKTAPSKTTYKQGDFFDPSGLVITKTFEDNTKEDVSYSGNESAFTFSPSLTIALEPSITSVAITVGGKTTNQAITVNALPTHTAHFSVNGTIDNNIDCVANEGAAITFPADPADVYGKKFVGWYTAEYSHASTAPAFVNSATMGNADVTYYAVFADEEVGNDTPTTFYYEPFTGSAHSTGFTSDNVAATQSMFYDKSATVWSHYTDTKAPSTASYTTNLDGANMSNGIKIYKQLNNSTATILEVKGIDIRNAKNLNVSLYDRRSTSAATLQVEYKIDNVANYTSAGGTIAYSSSNDNWKFTDGLSISGTGSTLDLKISVVVTGSTNRTMVIDDVKVYGDLASITYSNYCTTVAPSTGTLNFVAQDTDDAYYATFSSTRNVLIPGVLEDDNTVISVYAVAVDNGNLVLTDFAEESGFNSKDGEGNIFVPANTGVLVKAEALGGNPLASLTYEFTESNISGYDASFNNLRASSVAMENSGYLFYKLAYKDSNCTPSTLGFYWGAAGGGAYTCSAGKAYLAVPTSDGAKAGFSFNEDETTGIENVENTSSSNVAYNLAGQRVNANTKGIVIINGKKVLNK